MKDNGWIGYWDGIREVSDGWMDYIAVYGVWK